MQQRADTTWASGECCTLPRAAQRRLPGGHPVSPPRLHDSPPKACHVCRGGCLLACRLVEELVAVAAQQGCYKVILDCSEDNQAFYEKCGLTRKEVQMVKYLDR